MKRMLPNLSKNFWVKQLAAVALLVGASFTQVLAQTFEYRSVKSGDWNTTTVWQKRQVGTSLWGNLGVNELPSFSGGPITIVNGHNVKVNITNLTIDELVVESGATLTINYPIGLTVNDGPGTDLLVNGTIVANGRGGENFGNIYTTVSSADITFAAGSVYKHEYQANPANSGRTAWGIIPTANWDPASTVEINVAGATASTSDIPPTFNITQEFGNLIWNTPLLSGNISLGSMLTDIKGSFEVISTGTSQLVLNPTTSDFYSLNIGKDFRVLNNSKVVFGAGQSNTNSGTFNLSIGRNLEVSPSGLFANSRVNAPVQVAFLGNGTISASTTATTALRNMNFEVAYGADVTLANPFVIASPGTIDVYGTLNTDLHSVSGGGYVNLNGGSTFGIGSPLGLNGNLSVSPSNHILISPNSTFIYNGIYPQTTGSLLPSSVANLVIANTGNLVELTNNLIVTGHLSLQNGVLSTKNRTLSLIESPTLRVETNTINNSYVEGTIRYEVGTGGPKSLLFPIGKNNVYRPILLDLTQDPGFNTYTATQTESALNISSSKYPGEVEMVSDKRFYTITRGGGAAFSAKITLAFNADEMINNTEMRIIKSNSNGIWSDLGGVVANNTVTSKDAFTSFSQFAIGYKNIAPLPVELISFKAEKAENAVNVTWATASEKNNAFFVVERSADGKNFTSVGQVEGNGTSSSAKNYAFLDKNPLQNLSYYRLKQVDLDGTFEYSQIVKVVLSNRLAGVSLTAFPNPTTDNVTLQVAGLDNTATVQVLDLTGRVISEQQIVKEAKINMATLPAGIYHIKLVSENGTSSLKVIKK